MTEAIKRVEIPNLEIHLSHACNLACSNCSHYSDYKHKGIISVEDAHNEFAMWSARIKPNIFSLLGGEPALNHNLTEIVKISRDYWHDSDIQLVTNGFYLFKHPDLPKILQDTKCRLEISVHHQSKEYQDKLIPVKALINDWKSKYNFYCNWRPSSSTWRKSYIGYGKDMKPYDSDPQRAWDICISRWCPQILGGKIYKCPPLAYLPMQKEKFSIGPEWDSYLEYEGISVEATDEELHEFLNRKAESYCKMCPGHVELFKLENPIRGLTSLGNTV